MMQPELLTKTEIKNLVSGLQRVPKYGHFTIDDGKFALGDKTVSVYQLWLSHNGFTDTVKHGYIGASVDLLKLTERGRRLASSKGYRWLLFKERLDSSNKYLAISISVLAFLSTVAFQYFDYTTNNRNEAKMQKLEELIEAEKQEAIFHSDSLYQTYLKSKQRK